MDLEAFGFTKREQEIYLVLLQEGACSAGELSTSAQINRRTTYDTLERLEEKGIVSHSIEGGTRMYHAMRPRIILEQLDEKRRKAERLLPELERLYEHQRDETTVETYRGRKGIRNLLRLLASYDTYVSFGSADQFPRLMKHDFWWFQEEKKRKGIDGRTLLSEDIRGLDVVKRTPSQIRFLPGELQAPSSTFVTEDVVIILIWEQPLHGILITNSRVAQGYREHFEHLWKQAKP